MKYILPYNVKLSGTPMNLGDGVRVMVSGASTVSKNTGQNTAYNLARDVVALLCLFHEMPGR